MALNDLSNDIGSGIDSDSGGEKKMKNVSPKFNGNLNGLLPVVVAAAAEYDAEVVVFVDIAEKHWKHSDDILTAAVHIATAARSDDDWLRFADDRPLDMLVVNVAACDKRYFAHKGDCDGFCSRHSFGSKAPPDGIHCSAFVAIGIAIHTYLR